MPILHDPSAEPVKRAARRDLPFHTVALVLQGGGALGAYQAGVIQGLDEAGIEPNWIAGISIGALNTALIAGNAPEHRVARLREFWETICRPAFFQPSADALHAWVERLGRLRKGWGAGLTEPHHFWGSQQEVKLRSAFNAFEAGRALMEGQNGFFIPRLPPPWASVALPPDEVSYYDTTQLKTTLERLVDFDRINHGGVRVSVGAVNVRTGNFEYFDNSAGRWKGRLTAEHFMASGALPPGFPAIEIEGEFYWDGGIVSNTPLSEVLGAQPRHDTLAFQVDLWSARGALPTNIWDVQERQKDIQFSSRTRAITDAMAREQKLRTMIREVLAQVPAAMRKNDPWCKQAQDWACGRQVKVIHLIYRDKEWDGLSKDYEFSAPTMRDHWASGLDDIRRTLEHPQWLDRKPGEPEFMTYDVHRHLAAASRAASVSASATPLASAATDAPAAKKPAKQPRAQTSARPASPKKPRLSESTRR